MNTLLTSTTMQAALDHLGPVEWLMHHPRSGAPYTLAEKALVAVMSQALGVGSYDLPLHRMSPVPINGAQIIIRDTLSTFDRPQLTTMVFAAHELGARIEVSPHQHNYLCVSLHLRSHRPEEDGARLHLRHPMLQEAIDGHRWLGDPGETRQDLLDQIEKLQGVIDRLEGAALEAGPRIIALEEACQELTKAFLISDEPKQVRVEDLEHHAWYRVKINGPHGVCWEMMRYQSAFPAGFLFPGDCCTTYEVERDDDGVWHMHKWTILEVWTVRVEVPS